MKLKEEIKKTFDNPKEINYYRTKWSVLVLAATALLFFWAYFLIWAWAYPKTLTYVLSFLYLMFTFSIFLYWYNFLHYKLLWKNKVILIVIFVVLFLVFIFLSLPFIASIDSIKSII